MSGPSDSLHRLAGIFERLIDALRIDGVPEGSSEDGSDSPRGQSQVGLTSEGEGLSVVPELAGHSETDRSVTTFLGKVERDLFGLSDKTEEPK